MIDSLLEEVKEIASSNHDDVLFRLLNSERMKLNTVPEGQTLESYTGICLANYVEAKIQLHRASRKLHSGNGSSCYHEFDGDELDGILREISAADRIVKETQAKYYEAVGREVKQ